MGRTILEVQARLVAKDFASFMESLRDFRRLAGLGKLSDDMGTILAAVGATDKVARVSRYVKHQIREDPKPDFPDGMSSEMFGVVVYLDLIATRYNVDMTEGIVAELLKGASQHGGRDEREES